MYYTKQGILCGQFYLIFANNWWQNFRFDCSKILKVKGQQWLEKLEVEQKATPF